MRRWGYICKFPCMWKKVRGSKAGRIPFIVFNP
jgi:hypothetical protein